MQRDPPSLSRGFSHTWNGRKPLLQHSKGVAAKPAAGRPSPEATSTIDDLDISYADGSYRFVFLPLRLCIFSWLLVLPPFGFFSLHDCPAKEPVAGLSRVICLVRMPRSALSPRCMLCWHSRGVCLDRFSCSALSQSKGMSELHSRLPIQMHCSVS